MPDIPGVVTTIPADRRDSGRSFSDFMSEVASQLGENAQSKGYSQGGPDGRNPLFEVTGSNHAMGEAIYKAVRYRRKGNPEDLIKLAAWAFLAWKFHGQQTGQ